MKVRLYGHPADKKDLTTFCNMLSNTYLKIVKNSLFVLFVFFFVLFFFVLFFVFVYFHSKRVLLCVMHSGISHLLHLQLF